MQPTHDVVIIGAGQAGLATAHYLQQLGVNPLLLEAASTIGEVWRGRYDSLRLFTPSQYSNLPGLAFPAPADHYPTKDEVADYLRAYAAKFDFNIAYEARVTRLTQTADYFELEIGAEIMAAKAIIVATGALQSPKVPAFASRLHASVNQLHSSHYRNPKMIPDGDILIVGGGNSGAQIGEELATAGCNVSVSIEKLPRHLPQRFLGKDIFWWLTKSGFVSTKPAKLVGSTSRTPIPTIGVDLKKLSQTGRLSIVSRVTDAEGQHLLLADGSRLAPANIVWATGFVNDFSWIDIQGATEDQKPIHKRGVSPVKGLYFIGLPFLHSKGSAFLGFVDYDAHYVAKVTASVFT
jgi:putative flavoprotein involved in K+ transport